MKWLASAAVLLVLANAQPSPEAQRRVEEATAAQREAVRLQPQSSAAYRALADAYAANKFMRASSEALTQAVALDPTDASNRVALGASLRRVGNPDGAKSHFQQAIKLDRAPNNPSAHDAHIHLSYLEATPAERERAVRAAIALNPQSFGAYSRLGRISEEEKRNADAESAYRALAEIDPVAGAKKLFTYLRFSERKLEAAVEFRKGQLRARLHSMMGGEAAPPKPGLDEWSSWMDDIEERADTFAPKCLERGCIEGLDEALVQTAGGAVAAELPAPHTAAAVIGMIKGAPNPVPTVLRGGGAGWGPSLKWDAEHLRSAAGDEELEVTISTEAGSFEVRPDRIERPPKSVMRLGDFVRLLASKRDVNLTIYSRQAPLWTMAGLMRDLAFKTHAWMAPLRLNDLNFWLGDGHFRNTLHWDPYDNFLCQVRGSKHLLLYPPEAKDSLYYAPRKDIQANYSPKRGEYGRHDTGIVSENTASINGARPDLGAFPKFAEALKVQSYASLGPSDCLYIPSGWHHHVFSEADTSGGYNLALNLWISKEATIGGVPPRPDYRKERFPTIKQVGAALEALEPTAHEQGGDEGSCAVSDG